MGAYDPDTGFRSGSLAARNPGAYFAIFGAVYAILWFGLSMAGHHAKTGKYIVAAVIVSVVFGGLTAGLHYLIWRWRTARGRKASGASNQ